MKRVVIVGGGIAGLATALRLSRDGWRTLLVERAPATVADAALGPRTLTVFRGDLETALFEAARDHVEIRFGTTVAAANQDAGGVEIKLSDGTTVDADLFVGADGLHSATRTAMFGSGYRVDLPYVVAAFPLTPPATSVPESSATTFIGPGRTASIINLGPRRSSAFFTYRCADPGRELDRGPVDALSTTFGDLAAGVPEAIGHLRANPAVAYFDRVSQVDMRRWSTGHIALLGDAAWCVTLFAGHGAALALAGADQLGTALWIGTATTSPPLWPAGRPACVPRSSSDRPSLAEVCISTHPRPGSMCG